MRTTTVVGLILALGSAALISLAYLREHAAAAGLPPLSLRRPLHSIGLLLADRSWLIGFAIETIGFGLYAAALALAPLALVQSVAAGGVGILAFATAQLEHRRLSRREIAGAAVAVAGLAGLGVSLGGGDARDAQGSITEITLWLGATAALAVIVMTAGRTALKRGVAEGLAGGLFFAAGDICTKLATEGGTRTLFAIALVLGYLLGTSLLQIGYQKGATLTVAGVATLFTNAVPIAAGTVVLHEAVPTGLLGFVRVLAFAAVTIGAILLARPARRASPAGAGRHEPGQPRPEPGTSPVPLTRA
jgi:drug/metabolite transporter (DMT)-like permease